MNQLQGKLVHFSLPECRLLVKGRRAWVHLDSLFHFCVLARHNHHEECLNVGVVGGEHHAQGTSFAALIKLRQKLAA